MDDYDWTGSAEGFESQGMDEELPGLGGEYDFSNSGWNDSLGDMWGDGSYGFSDNPQFQMQQMPQQMDFQNWQQDPYLVNTGGSGWEQTGSGGSIQDTLQKIFTNPNVLGKGLSALMTGSQNKKMANNMSNIASSQRLDPFGSQRPVYQQELQNAIKDPNSIPLIKQQTDAIARAQAIKDAAAGRRSNNATSSPAMLAAQAEAAQKYISSMMTPAGANINPNSDAMYKAMSSSAGYDTNGYTSPLLYALGQDQRGGFNTSRIEELLAEIKKAQGK